MDRWTIIHDYRRAVRRGRAPELKCPYCEDAPLLVTTTKADEPMLICYECTTKTTPGVAFYESLKEYM